MQRVLSSDLWSTVRTYARKAVQRKVAVAYVTKELVSFRAGDILIVNASRQAIASGETAAQLLRSLYMRGVLVYDCPNLHAKVMLLDKVAVIGSGNLSNSSVDGLVEAGLITDQSGTVAGVASLIEQLRNQSKGLTGRDLERLCKIKVVRRGGPPFGRKKGAKKTARVSQLGNQTWLVAVRELPNDPPASEQRMIDKAKKILQEGSKIEPEDDPNWIRWNSRSRFIGRCREGDSLIQIWSTPKAKRPSVVIKTVPLLLKQKTKAWCRTYLGEPSGRYQEISWGKFKRLLKEVGYTRKVTARSVRLLDANTADAINRKWNSIAQG